MFFYSSTVRVFPVFGICTYTPYQLIGACIPERRAVEECKAPPSVYRRVVFVVPPSGYERMVNPITECARRSVRPRQDTGVA